MIFTRRPTKLEALLLDLGGDDDAALVERRATFSDKEATAASRSAILRRISSSAARETGVEASWDLIS
jgi:hypothetical protein